MNSSRAILLILVVLTSQLCTVRATNLFPNDTSESDTSVRSMAPSVSIGAGVRFGASINGQSSFYPGIIATGSVEFPINKRHSTFLCYDLYVWSARIRDIQFGDTSINVIGWGTIVDVKFVLGTFLDIIKPALHVGFAKPQSLLPVLAPFIAIGMSSEFRLQHNLDVVFSGRSVIQVWLTDPGNELQYYEQPVFCTVGIRSQF